MKSIPVLVPHAPALNLVMPLLNEAHANRRYTNHGPLETRLREQLANRFGRSGAEAVAMLSSGTAAITASLKAFGLPEGSLCLVPSWTFVGTACAVVQAGLEPVFVDVNHESWMPTVEMIDLARRQTGAKSAVVVAPFGAPVDYEGLADYASHTDFKILVDAAAAFDFVERLGTSHAKFTLPIMVSLHATKLASSLEGGVVLWDDPTAIRRIVSWSNFGIYNQEPVADIGCNAKLSEAHAAYGLSSLTIWHGVKDRMRVLADRYVALFTERNVNIEFAPNILTHLVTSTFNVVLPHSSETVRDAIARHGIETRKWWRDGVHNLPAYQKFNRIGDLAVTDSLARTVLGIPFHYDLSAEDQEFIVDRICETAEEKCP